MTLGAAELVPVTVIGGYLGAGKTTMINAHIKKYNAELHVMMSSNFSSTTTPQLFQKQAK